jgi:hypothetical protein
MLHLLIAFFRGDCASAQKQWLREDERIAGTGKVRAAADQERYRSYLGRRCLRLSDDGAAIVPMTPAERDAFRSTRSDVDAFMSEPELGQLGYKHVIRYAKSGEKFVTLEPMTESGRLPLLRTGCAAPPDLVIEEAKPEHPSESSRRHILRHGSGSSARCLCDPPAVLPAPSTPEMMRSGVRVIIATGGRLDILGQSIRWIRPSVSVGTLEASP